MAGVTHDANDFESLCRLRAQTCDHCRGLHVHETTESDENQSESEVDSESATSEDELDSGDDQSLSSGSFFESG
eukprot:CAMPEP_0178807984 /NCGR_PEP_ID=MMETSP0745-20121128/17250_1 /TAXON_ID=913974 /ORGANISM="Nitzschia punctata, Strain CCMP561" /LENGTH=73 /DNA_ID=CAMNT_0020468079 /DNA_START=3 /DNA_END=221 /DNA_ORIENTATION=+